METVMFLDILSDRFIKWSFVLLVLGFVALVPLSTDEPRTVTTGISNGQPPAAYPLSGIVIGEDGERIAIPEGYSIETTPVTCWQLDTTVMCTPEEAPDGTHVAYFVDNSPVYGENWILLVNDATGVVSWDYIGPSALFV